MTEKDTLKSPQSPASPSLEECKALFDQKFREFLERRKNDIGENRSAWRIVTISFSNKRLHREKQIVVKITQNNHPSIALTYNNDWPVHPADRDALRSYIENAITHAGFVICNDRLSSATIEGVKNRELEAISAFHQKHSNALQRRAEKGLRYYGMVRRSLKEPEDIVSEVFLRLLTSSSQAKKQHSHINLNIRNECHPGRAFRKMHRRESSRNPDMDFDAIPAREQKDPDVPDFADALPDILEATRTRLTPKQKEVLDIILSYEAERDDRSLDEYKPLTMEAIARQLGVTRERIRQQMEKIAQACIKTAEEMGHEELAATMRYSTSRDRNCAQR